jgi:hypothetical protein
MAHAREQSPIITAALQVQVQELLIPAKKQTHSRQNSGVRLAHNLHAHWPVRTSVAA